MINDIFDLDTQKKVRYVSESFSEGTSGNVSGSPGPVSVFGAGNSPSTNTSPLYSMPPSPALSPATALQSEFCNLLLPSNALKQEKQLIKLKQSDVEKQQQIQRLEHVSNVHFNYSNMDCSHGIISIDPFLGNFQKNMQVNRSSPTFLRHQPVTADLVQPEYTAKLRILEQPVDMFRFRYKSEMHGTHGSLNGINSKRTPKTFPEVELVGFSGDAVIVCSLFQADIPSPHPHQLIVCKYDTDICDPHKLYVSQEKGYVAQFQNMGIIHTAKKFIFDELLKKKKSHLMFKLGRAELSSREEQLLRTETEKEAKTMNVNQVRLCFEAFKIEHDNSWTCIAAPVYTHTINNRKSAQTGELRICRLSIASGNVSGGDDLILLVEKVNKKNVKVRFYEVNDEEEIIWEAFGKFRESDVHHQYAIVCTTPPYGNKDIEKPVDVLIELMRPSDDERSYPPVSFRYKPRSAVVSRKRRRTCSSATNSGSTSSTSSFELPKTVQEQTLGMEPPSAPQQHQQIHQNSRPTISEEFNKDWLLNSEELRQIISHDTDDLLNIYAVETLDDLMLEHDGASSSCSAPGAVLLAKNISEEKKRKLLLQSLSAIPNKYVEAIMTIYNKANLESTSRAKYVDYAREVAEAFRDYATKNEDYDSIMHEIIMTDKVGEAIKVCEVLKFFKLEDILNKSLNSNGESCLHCACLHNKPHFIRPLLVIGCDPNIQDRVGNTALHIAVQESNKQCIASFLHYMLSSKRQAQKYRVNLKLTNDAGLSALHLAVRNNSLQLIEEFLRYDKSAALVCNTMDGNNVLHTAVLHKNVLLIKLLLQLQIGGLESRNSAGRTALELTKTLDAAERKIISELLQQQTSSGDDIRRSPVVIKEEDMTSSSSNTEDEDEEMEKTEQLIELTEIKAEETKSSDEDEFQPTDTGAKLQSLLSDEPNFELLSSRLDRKERWRSLAQLLKMQHLSCLWTNALTMLSYVRSNADSIGYNTFVNALKQVDEKALLIFENVQ